MTNILCFDPSGNWSDKEGKGTTGWSFFYEDILSGFNSISAEDYDSMEEYWQAHTDLLDLILDPIEVIVCESYKLQPGKAMQQSWSSLETPQLIGYLRMEAWRRGIPFILQDPSIKQRFTDKVLVTTGYAEKRPSGIHINGKSTNLHIRDSIRHGLYYYRFGEGKVKK